MSDKEKRPADASDLRRRAEERARKNAARSPENLKTLSPEEIQKTLHELRVHQIELEMQNEELRRAQTELDAAQARYFDLYDLAPVGYCTLSENGLILEANLVAATLLGMARGGLIEQPISRFIFKDDVDANYLNRKQLFKTRAPQSNDLRMLRLDGTSFWARLDAAAAVDADGAPVCRITFSDITERKRKEIYVEMGRDILRILNGPGSLQDSIESIIAVLMAGSGCEAVGIRLQDGEDFPYAAQRGFSKGFLLKENTLIAHAADGGTCRDEHGKARLECTCGLVISGKTDKPDKAEQLLTPGGSFWTNDSFPLLDIPPNEDPRYQPRNNCIKLGYASVALVPIRTQDKIVGLIQLNDRRKGCFTLDAVELLEGIAAHIGEALMRKRAEEALRDSETRYRALFEQTRDCILVLELPANGPPIIRDVNPAALRFHGYSRDELIGQSILKLDVEEDPLPVFEERKRLAAAPAGAHFEVRHRSKDGSIFTAEASVKSFPIGSTIFAVSVERDVTESRKSAAALASMQKLESLGILAGGIAHDFNNSLTAILGNLSLLESEMKVEGSALELVKEAQEACANAKSLSHQLLTFAKGGVPVVKVMDLRSLLTQAGGFSVRGSKVRCLFELGESPLAVNVDKEQIAQVIQNLVINATQAMPQGGDITVRAAGVNLGEGEHPPLAAGRYVRVNVSDQGAGIPAQILPKVFDPYFSTKATGRGLGLAVCYSIMAKHGGLIAVDSAPGAGAVFTLHFPAANAADIAPEGRRPALTAGSGRVLIMDDEESVAKVLKRMLEHMGYQAEFVGDGQAALDAYKKALEADKPYDAVIMDLTIPGGLGGRETIVKLMVLDPKAKAIVSSGYSNDPVMSDYAAHGFCGVLCKPYLIEEVSEALRLLLSPKQF